MPHPFLIALQFLTRFPVKLKTTVDEQASGQSLLYYPVVGLLIGCLLALIATANELNSGVSALVAALVVTAWVLITGGLHIDGLSDSTDAWLAGGDQQRTLAIMKDPYCGPAGAYSIVLVLLLKFAAVLVIIEHQALIWLVVTPIIARIAALYLMIYVPYVSSDGLASSLIEQMPSNRIKQVALLSVLLIAIATGGNGLIVLLAVIALYLFLRSLMLKRIGGTTGDTLGATIEITEAVVLLVAALMV